MRIIKIVFALVLLLSLKIYASPVNDALEITATICHFSDSGLRCTCPEEARENKVEAHKALKKVRRQCGRICPETI